MGQTISKVVQIFKSYGDLSLSHKLGYSLQPLSSGYLSCSWILCYPHSEAVILSPKNDIVWDFCFTNLCRTSFWDWGIIFKRKWHKGMSPPWEPTAEEMLLFYGTWGYKHIPAGICIMNIYFHPFIPLEPLREGSSPIRIIHYMLPLIWSRGIIWYALVTPLLTWHRINFI